jgi:hypothetical protein
MHRHMNQTEKTRLLLQGNDVPHSEYQNEDVTVFTLDPDDGDDQRLRAIVTVEGSTPNIMLNVSGITPERALSMATDEPEDYFHEPDGWYKCPGCGCVVGYDDQSDDYRVITMTDYIIPFNYCPRCGHPVHIVKTDERERSE